MDNIKVSVIMPTYNRLELLKRAIDSFFEQIYDNSELLILDNGSTDGTAEYLKKFSNDKRVKIYTNEKNEKHTLNFLWNKAKGDLICQLHDDDELCEYGLYYRVKCFEKNPNLGVVYGGVVEQDINGDIIRCIHPQVPDKNRILTDEYINFTTLMWRKGIKTRFMFDEELFYYADWFFKIRCLQECRTDITNAPIMRYTIHPGQESVRLRGTGKEEEKIMRKKIKELYGI